MTIAAIHHRMHSFCTRFGLGVPILLSPMGGVSAPSLSIAVANAGGMGALGAVLMKPEQITAWADEVRRSSAGPFQINDWIPDPQPQRNDAFESAWRGFLQDWGPVVAAESVSAGQGDFQASFDAMLAAEPRVISSIMGIYPSAMVNALKDHGIAWFATVTTVAEAQAAEQAGADVIVAQGAEAGGHRGTFDAHLAQRTAVGTFSLLPAVVDAVDLPVVAAGGIADGRGVAAAFMLGASAVQIGTAFLRSPEANIPSSWAQALASTAPEDTVLTPIFTGRTGRAMVTDFVAATLSPDAPPAAPYPIQRSLTGAMRAAGAQQNDLHRIQAWAGQSSALGQSLPAAQLLSSIWREAEALLS